jgi:hypothetical protein
MAQLTSNVNITRVFSGGSAASGSSVADGLASASVALSGLEGVVFVGTVVQGGTGGAVSLSVRQTTAAIVALTSGGQGTTLTGVTATVAAGSSATPEILAVDVSRFRDQYGSFAHAQWTIASSCAVAGPIVAYAYQPRASAVSTALSTTTTPQSTAAGLVRAVSPST